MKKLDSHQISYLAAPYSHPDPAVVEDRISRLCRVDAKLMKAGIYTVSPLLKHFIVNYESLPADWNYWQGYSRALLLQVDQLIVVLLDGWQESVGVQAEIELAHALDIPVVYADENGNLFKPSYNQECNLPT